MYLTKKTPAKWLKDVPARQSHCEVCGGDSVQGLFWVMDGFRLLFMGAPILGKKRYVWVCSECDNLGEEVTKMQAMALKTG